MIQRIVRAAKLESAFYEEAEANPTYMAGARNVVIVVSLLTGLGSMLSGLDKGISSALLGLVLGVALSLLSWFVWAAITLWIGTKITKGPETRSDMGEMLRVLGYAQAPNVLGFFVFVPMLGPVLAGAGAIWTLLAGIVGIRQALDFTTGRAIVTVLLGWVVLVVLRMLTQLVLGGLGLNPAAVTG